MSEPKTTDKDAHCNNKDKENKLPDLGWREETKAASTPKSSGIPPRSFHGSSKDRIRARPGADRVQAIHAEAEENALRKQKEEHSKVQKLKRSAFKDVTSLKEFPLQAQAMEHYQNLLRVYLNKDDIDDTLPKPEHEYGGSSSSCASTDRKRFMTDKNLSPSKATLKQKYMENFRSELEIPAHNVATASCDPMTKFDPGLWSLEPRVFSIEKANGKRKYLVGHFGRIMNHLWRSDKCNRHFYELILEKTPCRLYFDLEYSVPDNPDIDNEKLLDELYEELTTELKIQYPGYVEGFDRECIVDLDSSIPQKFSRHWIIHLPSKALFKDNQEVGKFVKTLVQKLADEAATGVLGDRCPCLQKHLFVNPKGTIKNKEDEIPDLPMSKKSCFVDTGVYTRNRLFRLLGSSKFGKSPDCALRFAENNEFPLPRGFGNELFYVPAMTKPDSDDSSDDDDKLDEEAKADSLAKFRAQTDWSPHAQVTGRTLVVPLNIPKIDYPLLPEIDDSTDTKKIYAHFSGPASQKASSSETGRATYSSSRPCFGSSPYPFVDAFILDELAGRGGVPGSIRAWTLDYGLEDSNKVPTGISFHLSRNRWCEGIGRAHRSNNILWKVDFRTKQCIQSCFDPDCRAMNFRGTPVGLPLEVALQLDDKLLDEAIATMDEGKLLGKAPNNNERVSDKKSGGDNPGFDGADDDDFEQALANLKLDDGSDESDVDPLSDDALLDALTQNPELFH